MKMNANFSELGLDDPDKKQAFADDFAKSMEAKLGGGNKVIVKSITAGSINVDFEVEANGTDSDSLDALESSTKTLQNDLKTSGITLAINGTTIPAPTQVVVIKEVDVTPPVTETYAFNFKLAGEYSYYSDKSSSNYTELITAIVEEMARIGGLQSYINPNISGGSRIPKENITLSEGSIIVDGIVERREGDPSMQARVDAVVTAAEEGSFEAGDLRSQPTPAPTTAEPIVQPASTGISGGAIAGIVIGVILVVVIIIIILVLFVKSGNKGNTVDPERSESPASSRGAIVSHHHDEDDTSSQEA